MGATKDQALIVHPRNNYKKKENYHHNKNKDNKQNKIKRDPSNVLCYTCDEKGHFLRDYSFRKNGIHAHVSKDDEPTKKIFKWEKDDSYEEHVLISTPTGTISHRSNDWLVDSGASKHMIGYKE